MLKKAPIRVLFLCGNLTVGGRSNVDVKAELETD